MHQKNWTCAQGEREEIQSNLFIYGKPAIVLKQWKCETDYRTGTAAHFGTDSSLHKQGSLKTALKVFFISFLVLPDCFGITF